MKLWMQNVIWDRYLHDSERNLQRRTEFDDAYSHMRICMRVSYVMTIRIILSWKLFQRAITHINSIVQPTPFVMCKFPQIWQTNRIFCSERRERRNFNRNTKLGNCESSNRWNIIKYMLRSKRFRWLCSHRIDPSRSFRLFIMQYDVCGLRKFSEMRSYEHPVLPVRFPMSSMSCMNFSFYRLNHRRTLPS